MKLILLQLVVEHMRVGQNSHWGKALTGVKLSWGKAFTGVKLSFSLYLGQLDGSTSSID